MTARKSKLGENRLIEKLEKGEPAIGIQLRRGAYMVNYLAEAGFDWFINDLMHGGLDWAEAEHMVRAGEASGITPAMRVNSMPWAAPTPDRHLAAEIARTVSLGYQLILWSISHLDEVEMFLRMESDWHKDVPLSSGEEFEAAEKEMKRATIISPLIESQEGINNIEQIMEVPGLRMISIAVTDTSILMGHPFNVEHKDVWAFVDKVVDMARKRNIWVLANTSYMFNSIDKNVDRIKRLVDHGVNLIWVQSVGYLVHWASKAIIDSVKG
ncbi:MAG: hypothetical protein H8E17_12775 [Deltaproteobacteria bacterium]|nr:hypothetical protein [Deltaproteobacteria bacterium]